MNKTLKILLLLFVAFSLTACGKKEDEKKPDKNKGTDIEDVVENKTDIKQGDLEFKNIKIESQGALNIVTATITNTGSKTVSFLAVLYMNDNSGRMLGRVDKQITSLEAGQAIDISIEIIGDYTTVSKYNVSIENLVEL